MSKMIRKTFVAVLLIALFTCSAITAQAHEAVDMTRDDCTLTIEMKYAGKPVAGGTLTLYRVGDVVESNGDFGFKWKDDLNCTVEMENLESKETATKVLECVKSANLEGITVRVDENGKADFDNLEIGLYLIEQKTAAEGYTEMNPFLVSLPRWEDGYYVYSVTAMAKAEIHVTPPDNPPDNPNPKLPQTGQLNWPVPLLAVFGVAFLVVGFTIRRRKNDA